MIKENERGGKAEARKTMLENKIEWRKRDKRLEKMWVGHGEQQQLCALRV